MARCNCAQKCFVCGNGKCDCDCVEGGPYLTQAAADAARRTRAPGDALREVVEALATACRDNLIRNTSDEDTVGVLQDAAEAALTHPGHKHAQEGES